MGTPRRASAAATALVVLLLGACGGDSGTPLSRAAFTKKANAECDSLRRASTDFHDAQQPTATGKHVSRSLNAAADRLRELVRNVDRLVPPDAVADQVATLLGILSNYADGLDKLAAKVESGQTFQNVLDANVSTVNRLNDFAGRAGQLVVNLGLTTCTPPS